MAQAKYKGTSLEEWKKANGYTDTSNGIKQTEGMSDVDYEIGQQLYNAYLKDTEAKTAHDTALQQAATDKANSERAAEISYMRLQKYLPQQLAKQGLYSKGITEDSYLKLHNNYMNNMQDIDKGYLDRKTALEQAYQSDVNTRQIATSDAVNTVVDKAYQREIESEQREIESEQREIESEQREKDSQLNYYNEANEALLNGSFARAKDVVATLKQYEDKVSKTQYNMLVNTAASLIKAYGYDAKSIDNKSIDNKGIDITDIEYIKDYVNTPKITTIQATGHDSLNKGDDITVNVKDLELTLESDGVAENPKASEYASENYIADGHFFVMPNDNSIYIYKDGTCYRVRAKNSGKNARKQFNQLGYYLRGGTRPLNEISE